MDELRSRVRGRDGATELKLAASYGAGMHGGWGSAA
jgi:hypothetical protein